MKEVQDLRVTVLRVQEVFAFFLLVETEVIKVKPSEVGGDVPKAVSKILFFQQCLALFDEVLKEANSVPSALAVTEGDRRRDFAWYIAYNYAKAMCDSPVEAKRIAAAVILALFDKYGDPRKLPQTQESGILHNLIQDLEDAETEVLAIDFQDWLDELKKSEKEFVAMVEQRTGERAARIKGIITQRRRETEAAYRDMIKAINAHYYTTEDGEYGALIDRLNVLISQQKTVLKTRSTNNAKKNNSEGETPEA